MISVVVTVCERDVRFLERCLASITWQLEDGDELIVVGDGIREVMASGYFVTWKSVLPRLGVSAARNVGWRAARNESIKFLDVDDLLCPFALNALRNDAADVTVGGQFVVHNGRLTGLRNADPAVLEQMKLANPLLVSHTMIRKSALERVGGFDERIHFEEDWDLWLKLHSAGATFGFVKAPLCFYTIDDDRRAVTDAQRDHNVEGVDVREYFRRTYGCRPEVAA